MALHEFRANGRAFLAGLIGLSSGQAIIGYINSIFAPQLVAEFGWSRGDLALTATAGMIAIIFVPIAGRLADVHGVRRIAAIGIVAYPLTFAGLSTMTGSIWEYVGWSIAQFVLCTTTTSSIYTRIVAERFDLSRGLALALIATGPAASGALASPLLTSIIDSAGWRTAYLTLAAIVAGSGALTLLLLPKGKARPIASASEAGSAAPARSGFVYRELAGHRAFWVLAGATLLCTLPNVLANLHLKMMLVDTGIGSAELGAMVSLFAGGGIAGRIASGFALDRFPAWLVAMIGMGLPVPGLLLLDSGSRDVGVLGSGILILGLAYGSEGDTIAYLVVRHFGIGLYSTVLSLMTATIALNGTIGALILAGTLDSTGGYSLFMKLCMASVTLGALAFGLLRGAPVAASPLRERTSP